MKVKLMLFLAVFALIAGTASAAGFALAGTAPNADNTPGYDTVLVPAPIDGVDINVAESYPPQYFLHIVSGLPSGCAAFDHYTVERDGNTIRVEFLNRVPADSDVSCTMVCGMKEHNIALGSDFVPGETYTVTVNDVTETFVAQ